MFPPPPYEEIEQIQEDLTNLETLVGTTAVATQISNAIDGLATEVYVDNKVAAMVNSAPETLDTLNELATALGNDPNFATTVANQIGGKVNRSGDTMTGELVAPTIYAKGTYPSHSFMNADGTPVVLMQADASKHRLGIHQKRGGTSIWKSNEAYFLPAPDLDQTDIVAYDILTSKSPVTIAQGGTGATGAVDAANNLLVQSLGPGIDIPANADLNDYTTPGNYRCSTSASGATIVNAPTSAAFTLKVYASTGTATGPNAWAYFVQRYISIHGSEWYRSIVFDGSATPTYFDWKRVYSDENKPSASDIGAAPAAHTHHNLIAAQGNAGELYWHDDFLLSSATRTVPSLHFGTALLYRHDSSASKYYPIYDEGNKPTPAAIGAMPLNPSSIEMSNGNGFIDFHFTGTSTDYTSRIIEDSENYLNINAFDGGKVKLGRVTAGTWQGSAIGLNYGGTGATTRAGAINNLFKIGTSPITSTTNDTVTKWMELGNGVTFYGTSEQLIDQPAQYGTLLNLSAANQAEISQLWFSAPNGAVYHRGANSSGWSGTWTKFYDTSNKPTPAEIGAATSSHTHNSITDGTASASIGIATTPILSMRKSGYNHWSIERVGDSDNRLKWHYYDPTTGAWQGNALLIDTNGGTINGAVTINNTLTANKVIGAVYA